MFTKRVQPLRDKYQPKVSPPVQAALKSLQKDFADGRMATIRNQLAFHYGDEKNLVETHWRKIPAGDPWDFYLHNLNVNSFYYASELVITGVLTQLAMPQTARGTPGHLGEEAIGFAAACELNNEISGKILAVLGEFIAVIHQRMELQVPARQRHESLVVKRRRTLHQDRRLLPFTNLSGDPKEDYLYRIRDAGLGISDIKRQENGILDVNTTSVGGNCCTNRAETAHSR